MSRAPAKPLSGSALHMTLTPAYDGRDKRVFAVLSMLAARNRIPLIATNQPLYHDTAAALCPISSRRSANTCRSLRPASCWRRMPSVISRTAGRWRACSGIIRMPSPIRKGSSRGLSFDLDELEHNYPDENDEGETPYETLERLTWAGATRRFQNGLTEKIRARSTMNSPSSGRRNTPLFSDGPPDHHACPI
jgi:DNA polymerase III alpha subunit